jgi:Uma2 family endonuclease
VKEGVRQMASPSKTMTVTEFDTYALLPENAERVLEFIGGEIFDVVSNNYSSQIAGEILFQLKLFLKTNQIGGYVTGADGGYMVSGERYIPDVAYISSKRQSKSSQKAYNPLAPDLAIEIIPNDSTLRVSIKIANYLAAGTVVWVVRPEDKEVEVFTPNQPVKVLGEKDTLEARGALEGFRLAVKDIFPQE